MSPDDSDHDFDHRVTSIAALADPVRRALYDYLAAQPDPVGRDEAASALGVPHHVAKFNLDRLERDGLLDVEYSRPAGRSGPGAGRPAKLYRRTGREVSVSLPDRRYELAGQVMATAISRAEATGIPVGEALAAAAAAAGNQLGLVARHRAGEDATPAALVGSIREVLAEEGYEPRVTDSTIRLANCPFHRLARGHTDLVCGMNLDLMGGLLDGAQAVELAARLDPVPGQCCVAIDTLLTSRSAVDPSSAPVAQGIEHRPPEAGA